MQEDQRKQLVTCNFTGYSMPALRINKNTVHAQQNLEIIAHLKSETSFSFINCRKTAELKLLKTFMYFVKVKIVLHLE